MRALIDGDVITYQAGFASDQTSYVAPDGTECRYMNDMKNYCKGKDISISTVTKKVRPEPLEYCLSSVKKMINGIKKAIDADDVLVLLSGKGNFREILYPEYKDNRDRSHRPIHYAEIRKYLIDTWKADEVIGVEADDAMGWHQYKDLIVSKGDMLSGESCICTIDKDLNQIPGWHYNWRHDDGEGSMFWIDPEQALRFFFEQWLSGDAADNIPGIPKVGEKTAQKLISELHHSLGGYPTAKQYYTFIQSTYSKRNPVNPKFVNMIGDLLWMQRNPGETWDMHLNLTAERKDYET